MSDIDLDELERTVLGWCRDTTYVLDPEWDHTVRLPDDHESFPGSEVATFEFDEMAQMFVRLMAAAPALIARVRALEAARGDVVVERDAAREAHRLSEAARDMVCNVGNAALAELRAERDDLRTRLSAAERVVSAAQRYWTAHDCDTPFEREVAAGTFGVAVAEWESQQKGESNAEH